MVKKEKKIIRPEDGSFSLLLFVIIIIFFKLLVSVLKDTIGNRLPRDFSMIITIIMHCVFIGFFFLFMGVKKRKMRFGLFNPKSFCKSPAPSTNAAQPNTSKVDTQTNFVNTNTSTIDAQTNFVNTNTNTSIADTQTKLSTSTSKKQIAVVYILAIVLAVCCFLAFALPANFIASTIIVATGYTPVTAYFHIAYIIIGAIVLAPISEELIFRGSLQGGISRGSSVTKAVMLSALAFSLMHMTIIQTFYQFMLGVVIGFAVAFTKRVAVAIIIHLVSNGLALTLPLLMPHLILINLGLYFMLLTFLMLIFGGLCFLILRFFFNKQKNQPESLPPLVEPVSIKTPDGEIISPELTKLAHNRKKLTSRLFFWLAIALCVIMWIYDFVLGVLR